MLKGIDFIQSEAKIISPNKIETINKTIETSFILVATGSNSTEIEKFKFNGNNILSSDDMLNLESTPKSLLIIGGGVIGCEFASLFSSLGTSVSLVEKMPQLLPNEDNEIAKKLESIFNKRNIQTYTLMDANEMNLSNFDKILVCVGRKPNLKNLGLENAGIKTANGTVVTNEYLATNVKNIFAAGD